jgi:NAD(P)-dependent dehydrogenase (short-subunit alcohol dehydrogenase family)
MQTVIITGSSRGIGLGMAREFLKRGCAVVLSARGEEQMHAEVHKLGDEFGPERVFGRACDVTDYARVQQLWDAAFERFGAIDIWINNAGITHAHRMLWELDPAEISGVIDTNITGLMYGCKVAMTGMLAQGYGRLYNFEGHGSNDMIQAGMGIYGTTKRAVRYLTEALIEEAGSTPVKIGFISPGMVITDLLINDLKRMTPERQAEVKTIFNILADTVETVTPYIVEEVLKDTATGSRIDWLTMEKAQARFEDPVYLERDLLSQFGI